MKEQIEILEKSLEEERNKAKNQQQTISLETSDESALTEVNKEIKHFFQPVLLFTINEDVTVFFLRQILRHLRVPREYCIYNIFRQL